MSHAAVCVFCLKPSRGGAHYTRPDGAKGFHCWEKNCDATGRAERELRRQYELWEMRRNRECLWEEAWVGYCRKPAAPGSELCMRHGSERCWSCDRQATANCSSAGSLVCGMPYCPEHPHERRH